MKKQRKLELNRNGIPIDLRINLALLRVMGVDDPFEGRRCDPQFEGLTNCKTKIEEEE